MYSERSTDEDVIIAGPDGKIYYLHKADYTSHPMNPESPGYEYVQNLIKHGVAVGDISKSCDPKESMLGMAPICYVLNLASFKTPDEMPE